MSILVMDCVGAGSEVGEVMTACVAFWERVRGYSLMIV